MTRSRQTAQVTTVACTASIRVRLNGMDLDMRDVIYVTAFAPMLRRRGRATNATMGPGMFFDRVAAKVKSRPQLVSVHGRPC